MPWPTPPGSRGTGAVTEVVQRASARIVVLDGDDRLLLIQFDDPRTADPAAWVTPGGGVEEGESLGQAACRELREETGRIARPSDFARPVAVSRGAWEFRGQPLYSEDWFFVWRVPAFEPDDAGWTELEREVHRGWRWWTAAELDRTDEVVFPAGLGDLVRALHGGAVPSELVVLPWRSF
jgi:8-oxo-dGTP pyrophosphatase MutT (NUDIX family)